MAQLPALADLDIGMASEADILANQIATELDLGLTPSLPAVADGSSTDAGRGNLPADAAAALAANNALAASINAQLQKNLDIGDEQAKTLADATVARIGAEQTKALVADTADLKAENNTIAIFEASGGQAAQLDRAKDAREFEIKLEALSEKRADILDDKHVGIGVIDAVINNFRVINTEKALEATAQQNAINQQAILSATAITESGSKTNLLVKKTANEATIVAGQTIIAATGQVELTNATLVQNRSRAETLQSMLANNSRMLSNTMAGFALEESIEGRELRREQHQLALRQDARNQKKDEIAIRRSQIAEQRETVTAGIEGRTANAREQAIFTSLDQQEVSLDQSILNLAEAVATSDDRIASAKLNRTQAETNLDIANLAFEQAQDDAENPEVAAAAKAKRDSAVIARDRARLELQEFEEEAGIRRSAKEGSLDAIELQNRIAKVQAEATEALAAGNRIEALAKLAESERLRTDEATTRAINVQNIRSYQSKLLGVDAMEDPAVIKNQLDLRNPLYEMMRQREATAEKDAQGNSKLNIGSTPAKAMAFLDQMEDAGLGVISNDITGVRILRAVSAILGKEDAENPQAAAALTEAGLAARFNARAIKYMEDNEEGIQWNDVTNPLQPLTIPQMVELANDAKEGEDPTGLASQPLFSKVLIPDGNIDPNPDAIFSKGIVAMQAGTISQDELVDGFVAWGNSIAINNNVNHHGMESIGLPHQTQVNMIMLKPRGIVDAFFAGMFDPKITLKSFRPDEFTTVNIADPVAVRQYLIAVMSSTTLGGEETPADISGDQ